MKLKLLFLAIVGSIAVANAQYTVTNDKGVVLQDGDVYEYGTYGYNAGADYTFTVTNNSATETIYTRLELVDIINADGSLLEICYAGACLSDLSIGFTAPEAPNVFSIAPGETTAPETDHIVNGDPGDGVYMIDYICTFHQYEADGVTEIGSPITFTYRYNPTLGLKENSKVNLTIQSTVITNELVLNVNEPITMKVYDLQGRVVKQGRLENGRQTVNMSNLGSQAYILQFNNDKGASQTTRIIVK